MAKLKKHVRVLRIDPVKQTIAALFMKQDMPSLRRMLKASTRDELGQENFILGEVHYTIFALMAQEVDQPGMRLRGWTQDTSGICLIMLYRNADRTGGLIDCDLDMEILKRELVWVDKCRQRLPKEEPHNDILDDKRGEPVPEVSTAEGANTDEGNSDEVD